MQVAGYGARRVCRWLDTITARAKRVNFFFLFFSFFLFVSFFLSFFLFFSFFSFLSFFFFFLSFDVYTVLGNAGAVQSPTRHVALCLEQQLHCS